MGATDKSRKRQEYEEELRADYVMGFCPKAEHRRFLKVCPEFETYVVGDGTLLLKFWPEVSDAEQKRRFEARTKDPLRQWKTCPTAPAGNDRTASPSAFYFHRLTCQLTE